MERLLEDIDRFYNESKTVIRKKSESIKLYGLAFNLAWALRNGIEICQKYEEEIKNSLLHDRFQHNKGISDRYEDSVDKIVPYIERVIFTVDVSVDDNERLEFIDDGDREKLLADNKYLSELSNELSKNGNRILNIVCFYLRYISKLLINTKTVRANMTDNDYRFLFEREFKDFLSTDEWNDQQNSFIERTINLRFHGEEPTKDQLYELLISEICKIEDLSDSFGSIEPYLDDFPKLSRLIMEREFKNDLNSPILELFLHMGRKKIIEQWYKQLESEEPSYVPEDDGEAEIKYSEKFTEAICMRIMPHIQKLYEEKNAMDWVCFYHVLVFYSYIACDDFNVFNRWLTRVTGKEIITNSNARKIKMSYWAKEAKKKWSKEKALEETNTPQQETKFRNYMKLCDEIRDIINEAKKAIS